jgi:single-stranded DNA-binding protein
MNSVQLIGKVTRPPLVRFEAPGVQVTNFTLTIDEVGRDGKHYPLFVPCIARGHSAEVASLLHPETLIGVQGKLTWHRHKAKCGQEHSTIVVNAWGITALQGPCPQGDAPAQLTLAGVGGSPPA